MANPNVRRFLVTAPTACLDDFLTLAWLAGANPIEQRDRTTFYTVLAEHVEGFLSLAQQNNVTVQELHGAGEDEHYETLIVGSHKLKWEPRQPKGETA